MATMNIINKPITCALCGVIIDDPADLYRHNGEDYCEDCYNDRVFVCEHCDNDCDCDNGHTVNVRGRYGIYPEMWCDYCTEVVALRCTECGELFDTAHTDDCGTVVCDDCYDRYYYRCDDCERLIREDEIHVDEGSGYCYCEDCYEANHRSLLEGYHHNKERHAWDAEGNMIAVNGTTRCYGIEIEVAQPDYCDTDIDQINSAVEEVGSIRTNYGTALRQLISFKEDCTLRNHNGFEMAFKPLTMDAVRDFPWEALREACLEYGYRSHSTTCSCGLHVHVNKSSIGEGYEYEATVSKMMIIIDKLWDHFAAYSRRTNFEWCDRPYKYDLPDEGDDVETAYKKLDKSNDHHAALNLRDYDPTIELRICRGSLNPETIIAAVQLHDVFIKVAKMHDIVSVFKATWEDFRTVAAEEGYIEMLNYMERRGC